MFFSYFELAASLTILLLAFNIFTRHYENMAARFFGKFALVGFLAALFEYSLRIAFTLDIARNINRLSATLWALAFAMLLHFALIFIKKDKWLYNKILFALFYLPVVILGILFFFTDSMYRLYEIWHIGIVSQPSPLYLLFALHTIAYVGTAVILLLWYSFNAIQKTVREQALIIALGSLIPAVIGVYTDELSPVIFGARTYWPTAVFDLAIMIFFVYYAMRKYSLFAISPALAADIIIETMPDSLMVTDLEGRIILLNDEAHKFFHAPKEAILGRPIYELFINRAKYQQLYAEVVDKNLEIERYSADLCDPLGQCIPSIINANKIRDSIGATLGIVFIIRDSRG